MRSPAAITPLILIPLLALTTESEEVRTGGIEPKSWPFESRLVLNPTIQEMVNLVSPEIMMSNLETLVSFQTRHTNSDTLSPDRGIGAARRWIYGKFEEYSLDPSAFGLEPSYFSFSARICDVVGEHRDVMARLPGIETPFRNFVDMGHMDSRTLDVCDSISYAPSANDDGSGTVVAMEMARVMSRYPFESTVVILIVTGEDQGLYGSTAYANWAFWNGIDIGAAITNDVVGNIEGCDDPACPPGEPVIIDSTSVRHFSGPPATGVSRQLARYMKLKSMEYVEGFTINLIPAIDRPGRSGDHVPFHNSGYPAARFTEAHENGDGSGDNGRQHNEYDIISPENTNAGYMANIVRLNIASIACLALAPRTPAGLEGVDMGDGYRVLLSWSDEQYEPDFSGYRIAIRPEAELFYSDIIDAGNVNEYILDELTDGETVYLSVSAYDFEGNESLFSPEIGFTPSSIPKIPTGLESTSTQFGVQLNWSANSEIDIQSYNIYRKSPDQDQPELITAVDHPVSQWLDVTAAPHTLYSYYISAVDNESNESEFSGPVFGQLASHDYGILMIDGTIDGGGNPFQPTDEEVDEYYDEITAGFNISGHWDVVDSNAIDLRVLDANLAPYSAILIHSDRPGSQLFQDTTAFRKYLTNGGNILVSGWNLSLALGGINSDSIDFPPGSFFQQFLKVDSIRVSPSQNRDFIGAPSLMPAIYPGLVIDSIKVPLFNNRLFRMEAFFGSLIDQPLTEALYIYESSLGENFPLHGKPVGLRYMGDDYKLVFFDVPLFFIKQEIATQAIRQAFMDLGEAQTGLNNDVTYAIPPRLRLIPNFPNPFNASTTISFELSAEDDIELTIYNLLGQRVETLIAGRQPAGIHSVNWDPGDIPSGIYFARLCAGGASRNIRLVLLK